MRAIRHHTHVDFFLFQIIKENTEAYVGGKLLFRFYKNVLDTKTWFPVLEECFGYASAHQRPMKNRQWCWKKKEWIPRADMSENVPLREETGSTATSHGIISFYDRLTLSKKQTLVGSHKGIALEK